MVNENYRVSEQLALFFANLPKDMEVPLSPEFHHEIQAIVAWKFDREYVSELPNDGSFTAALAYGANSYSRVVYQGLSYWTI